MKFLEILQEAFLSLGLAILLPITVYWGVQIIHPEPKYSQYITTKEPEERKAQHEEWQKARLPYQQTLFYATLITGLLLIIIGSFVHISSLGLGLIAAGIINIITAQIHNPHGAVANFILFLSCCLILIAVIISRTKR